MRTPSATRPSALSAGGRGRAPSGSAASAGSISTPMRASGPRGGQSRSTSAQLAAMAISHDEVSSSALARSSSRRVILVFAVRAREFGAAPPARRRSKSSRETVEPWGAASSGRSAAGCSSRPLIVSPDDSGAGASSPAPNRWAWLVVGSPGRKPTTDALDATPEVLDEEGEADRQEEGDGGPESRLNANSEAFG